jgi:hypothetical protein
MHLDLLLRRYAKIKIIILLIQLQSGLTEISKSSNQRDRQTAAIEGYVALRSSVRENSIRFMKSIKNCNSDSMDTAEVARVIQENIKICDVARKQLLDEVGVSVNDLGDGQTALWSYSSSKDSIVSKKS